VKKLKGILVLVLLLALLASPVAVFASDVTGSNFYGLIQVSNNGTAVTNVATTCNISTTSLMNGGYLNSSANNCAIQSSAGTDLPFQPSVNASYPWGLWVPALGADSIKTDILYAANSTGGKIRYFPGAGGMSTVDDPSLELGDNFTITQSGWVDTSYTLVETEANFQTFAEVDANSKLTVTTNKATAVNADRDEDVYLYKDEGVDYFDALDIDFEIYLADASLNFARGGIAFSVTTVGTLNDFDTKDISVVMVEDSPPRVELVRGDDTAVDTYNAATNTPYYCTLYRAAGSDSANCTIYSDTTRETALDSLIVAGFGTTKWRYVYGFINDNQTVAGRDFDGYVKDLVYPQKPELVSKGGAFKTYVSAAENITSEISGGVSISATGVESGEHEVKTTEQPVLGFDGNDYVDCGDDVLLDFTTAMTAELWLKPDTIDIATEPLTRDDNVNRNFYFWISNHTNRVYWYLFLETVQCDAASTTAVEKDVWMHVVGTYGDGHQIIYINGFAEDDDPATGTIDNDDVSLTIGAREGGMDRQFEGAIGEVRLYNRALTPAEVLEHYNGVFTNETGLVAHYPLSEGVGAVAHDTSGNGLDGAITGGNWGESFLRLYVDDELEDVDIGASVPDTSANWTFYQNLDDYWDYTEISVNGTQVQYIDWEYDTTFYDSSGFGNDATPTFRTTSSDADVSAELVSFSPIAEAKAPAYVLEEVVDFIEEVPVIVSEFSTTPPAGTFPLAGVITAVATATETPPQLPLVIIAGFTIIALSLAISGIMRKYGSGTILVKVIVIAALMGCFVAIGNFGIDFWMIVVFIIIGVALAMASRHVSWQ